MQGVARSRMPAPRPITIAHRGASGYLPEHSLAAKALAHGMGADYLEQDVVVSRDDHCVVLHDIHLDRVSDVAQRFPGRGREDGRYYARDFTLAELRTLSLRERVGDDGAPVFSGRYPSGATPRSRGLRGTAPRAPMRAVSCSIHWLGPAGTGIRIVSGFSALTLMKTYA